MLDSHARRSGVVPADVSYSAPAYRVPPAPHHGSEIAPPTDWLGELPLDLSELDLRSQRRRVVSGGDNFVPPQDAQRQLRPRRVDGCAPRHLPCAPVHSAGSRLPLEGTERYEMAQMTKIKIV